MGLSSEKFFVEELADGEAVHIMNLRCAEGELPTVTQSKFHDRKLLKEFLSSSGEPDGYICRFMWVCRSMGQTVADPTDQFIKGTHGGHYRLQGRC
jgi:hypothetical protein